MIDYLRLMRHIEDKAQVLLPDIREGDRIVPLGDEAWGVQRRLRNLRCFTGTRIRTVSGSLPKYDRGHNASTLDFGECGEAISRLEQDLGENLGGWRITQLELGVCVEVDHPVKEYLPDILSMPRHQRCSYQGQTVFFRNGVTEFKFYDKVAEMKSKGRMNMNVWAGRHLVRVEIRVVNTSEKLGRLTVDNLRDPVQFLRLIDYFEREFESIVFSDLQHVPDIGRRMTETQSFNALFGRLAQDAGIDRLTEYLESLKGRMTSSAFSGMRQKVHSLLSQARTGPRRGAELATKIQSEILRVRRSCPVTWPGPRSA